MPLADYPFSGPHKSLQKIEKRSGVFVVICEFVDKYYLLDVGHSDNVKQSILKHERKGCWEKYRKGRLRYAVFYTNKAAEEMRYIENIIRKKYGNIPCG
jgi:hypothetical protein